MMASMPEEQEVTSAALLKARKGNQQVKAESSTKNTKFGPGKDTEPGLGPSPSGYQD